MSNTLANILWLIFGGLLFAVGYFIAGLAFCITIIGIPFGVQLFKIGAYMLHPYGYRVYDDISADGGCLSVILNLLWICCFGVELAIMHVTIGILFYLTIIGFSFGNMHFRMAYLALFPFGKSIMEDFLP